MSGTDVYESVRKVIDELPGQLDIFIARLDPNFPCSQVSEKCHCCENSEAKECQSRFCDYISKLIDFMLLQFHAEGLAMRMVGAGRGLAGGFEEHKEAHGDMTARLVPLTHGEISFQRARVELLELLQFWKNEHVLTFDMLLAKALIAEGAAAPGPRDIPLPASNDPIGRRPDGAGSC